MIDKDRIAKACRDNDDEAEHEGLVPFMRKRGVNTEGLVYVADQRALRAVMMLNGQNPNVTEPTAVQLPRFIPLISTKQLSNILASAFVDGFAAGITVNPLSETSE